ncbi:MAG: hypothetical protein Q9218_007687 [Villophora microphyllina]
MLPTPQRCHPRFLLKTYQASGFHLFFPPTPIIPIISPPRRHRYWGIPCCLEAPSRNARALPQSSLVPGDEGYET